MAPFLAGALNKKSSTQKFFSACALRSLAVFLMLKLTPVFAMNFELEKPRDATKYLTGGAFFIFANGDITAESGKEFERFLTSNRVPRESIVYLNSPGGSVFGGMDLGRVIRKWKLNTSIGNSAHDSDQIKRSTINTGYCYSACTLSIHRRLF
jgi:hypothetical protein